MKAIFLLLLLAGCSSEEENISRSPPVVPSNDEWSLRETYTFSDNTQPYQGDDDSADEQVTQPAPAQGDDSNVGTLRNAPYTAPANYDTQHQYQQQQDDDTQRFYHNQDVQRQ